MSEGFFVILPPISYDQLKTGQELLARFLLYCKMLLSEVIYTIRQLRSGGDLSDDDGLNDAQWAFIVNYYRAKLLKEEVEAKARPVSESYVQNLGRVELRKVSEGICPEEFGCFLAPVKPLPLGVIANGKEALTYVGTIGNKPISRTTFSEMQYIPYRRHTSKLPYWFKGQEGLRVFQPPTLNMKWVQVRGIFEDPVVAAEYTACSSAGCLGYDIEYPMPSHWIDILIKLVAQAELALLKSAIDDATNNSEDDAVASPDPRPSVAASSPYRRSSR